MLSTALLYDPEILFLSVYLIINHMSTLIPVGYVLHTSQNRKTSQNSPVSYG